MEDQTASAHTHRKFAGPSLFAKRLEALSRAQHTPKALLDLLSLLVANAEDTDAFKAEAAARISVVESVARIPSSEIEAAKKATVMALQNAETRASELMEEMRAVQAAFHTDMELKLASVWENIRSFEQQRRCAEDDVRGLFSAELDSFQTSLADTVAHAVATATDAIREVQKDACTHIACEEANRKASFNGACESSAASSMDDVRRLGSEVAAKTKALMQEGCTTLQHSIDSAVSMLAHYFDVFEGLPLLECHRVAGLAEATDSRLVMLCKYAANKTEVRRLEERMLTVERIMCGCSLAATTRSNEENGDSMAAAPSTAAPSARRVSEVDYLSMSFARDSHVDQLAQGLQKLSGIVEHAVVDKVGPLARAVQSLFQLLSCDPAELPNLPDEQPSAKASSGTEESPTAVLQRTEWAAKYLASRPAFAFFSSSVAAAPHVSNLRLGLKFKDRDNCVVVEAVQDGGCAQIAGVEALDVVTHVNQMKVTSRVQVAVALSIAMSQGGRPPTSTPRQYDERTAGRAPLPPIQDGEGTQPSFGSFTMEVYRPSTCQSRVLFIAP